MFEEGVQDAPEAKRGLDDVGGVLANYVMGERADRSEKTVKNGLDCLNVLRCMVKRSGVSTISLPSARIAVGLRDVSSISADKDPPLTLARVLPGRTPARTGSSPR